MIGALLCCNAVSDSVNQITPTAVDGLRRLRLPRDAFQVTQRIAREAQPRRDVICRESLLALDRKIPGDSTSMLVRI